ncbi:hypothetical protein AZ037_005738, partial [Klebsiella michiganensis]
LLSLRQKVLELHLTLKIYGKHSYHYLIQAYKVIELIYFIIIFDSFFIN